jgi:RimJ/RimL family protein N-acetyltransferase
VLKTVRLTLRPTNAEDEDGIARAGNDPSIRDMPWFGSGFRPSDAAAWVRRAMAEWETGRNWTLSITDAADRYIGSVNLGSDTGHGRELAYWIVPEQRDRGFATEAVMAVLNWADVNLPVTRLWAKTRLDNVGSQRVLSKCGFEEIRRGRFAYFRRARPL